jgi:hypothetical protein
VETERYVRLPVANFLHTAQKGGIGSYFSSLIRRREGLLKSGLLDQNTALREKEEG